MKSNRILVSALGLIVLATSGPVRADDKPVTLARTLKKGDVTRYKTDATVTTANGDVQVVQTTKMTVKDVKDDGQNVVEQAGEGGKLNQGGTESDIPASPPIVITRDKVGKFVELKMDDAGPGFFSPEVTRILAIISDPIFKDKEVKPGDSWATEFDNPAAKGKKLTVKTTFVGIEKVDGTDVWKVKQTAEPETGDKGEKTSYEATHWLDPANGQEVKSESTIKDLPTMIGVLTMKSKTTRIKEEAK